MLFAQLVTKSVLGLLRRKAEVSRSGYPITLSQYLMGYDVKYGITNQQVENAIELIRRANLLLEPFLAHHPTFGVSLNSGYRPPAINAKTPRAAKKSRHMDCLAIDIDDDEGLLDEWCYANHEKLADIGLWMEHPASTKGWCHLQSVPPRSGNRAFYP